MAAAPNTFDRTTAGGGDWAQAAAVFRKYDADGSGRLDRSELVLALHESGLLATVTPSGAARVLAEMDDNRDGVVSFEEFRGAYSRLVKLRGEEARQARFRAAAAAPAVPSAAAVDPRLAAAFHEFASHGTAKGLAERTPRGCAEGMTSLQFQRACAAAGLTVGKAVVDVVFAGLCAGKTRTLPFIRFLEALAKVAQEAGVPLETALDMLRSTAPTLSPAKAPTSAAGSYTVSGGAPACSAPTTKAPACAALLVPLHSPRSKSASPRPKSAAPAAAGGRPAGAEVVTDGTTPPALKLQQRVVTLQQLLEEGALEGEDSIPAVHEAAAPDEVKAAGHSAVPTQQAQRAAGDHVLLNPAFQGPEPAADLPGFRLELLTLLEERCEAVEAHCAAVAGSRAALARELVERTAAALGGGSASGAPQQQQQQQALGALRSEFEARLAEADGRLGNAVRAVAAECRTVVAAVEERQSAQEAALRGEMKSMNEALLAIARRVGSMMQG